MKCCFFSLFWVVVKSDHLLHSGLAQAWLYWTYLETYSLTKYDLALATCLWSLTPYIFLYSLKGILRYLDRFLNFLRCFQLTLWKDKVSEKEKELAEALNEVRCLHVDTKIGGSVAEWLGLVLFSVVLSSGSRPNIANGLPFLTPLSLIYSSCFWHLMIVIIRKKILKSPLRLVFLMVGSSFSWSTGVMCVQFLCNFPIVNSQDLESRLLLPSDVWFLAFLKSTM